MDKPTVNIDPNGVIDYLSAEVAEKTRQYAELHVAFNSLVEENERLKTELGRHVNAPSPSPPRAVTANAGGRAINGADVDTGV